MALLCVFAACAVSASAQSLVSPKAYPTERYEPIWIKNPFALKTAPVAIHKESFAKDLAIGSISQIGDTTKVMLVNTKTRERFAVSTAADSPKGLKLRSVHLGDNRKDSVVEIESGTESAELYYDEALLRQLAAAGAASGKKSPTPSSSVAKNGTGTPPSPPSSPAGVPPPQPSTSPPSTLPPVPLQAAAATPRVAPGTIPTPQRRRMQTAPVPQALPRPVPQIR